MWFHYVPPAYVFPYIFFALVLFSLFVHIYIRLTYGFWYHQPVFHLYDLQYYFFPCGIIQHDLPVKNRYTNLKDIETFTFDTVMKHKYKLDTFLFLIQQHYIKEERVEFFPKEENIVPYFTGHNDPCFFSFYYEEELLQDLSNKGPDKSLIQSKKTISVMTTRPVEVMIHNKTNWNRFPAYYVDYLCVDKMYRKKGTAPQIIQTHHYNQRHSNKKIQVSLFKREGQLTGIVPLCVYTTYGFSMDTWFKSPLMDPAFKTVKCSGHNVRFLLDFMKETRKMFDVCIGPELSNVLELIKTDNLYIYVLMDTVNDCILAAYFFRKVCTYVGKNKEKGYLSLFASICKTEKGTFLDGFHSALGSILPKTDFHYLAIERLSHNDVIADSIREKYKAESETPMAYFFYNFAYHTFRPEKTFILL